MIAVTLLAVACAFVREQAHVVAARQAWLKLDDQSEMNGPVTIGSIIEPADKDAAPSLLRKWLGDERRGLIHVRPNITDSEISELHELFPEAELYVHD